VVNEYPLLPIAEEVAERYRERLEAEGWTVEVAPNVPGTVVVRLDHPLVPGPHTFGTTSRHTTAERARGFWVDCFETHYQFEVVRNAPVRPERLDLVRQFRGIGMSRPSEEAGVRGEAIISAGYILFEEGILLREEADWLAEAVRRDLQEDEDRFGGLNTD
jgi:hypothetical protein